MDATEAAGRAAQVLERAEGLADDNPGGSGALCAVADTWIRLSNSLRDAANR